MEHKQVLGFERRCDYEKKAKLTPLAGGVGAVTDVIPSPRPACAENIESNPILDLSLGGLRETSIASIRYIMFNKMVAMEFTK